VNRALNNGRRNNALRVFAGGVDPESLAILQQRLGRIVTHSPRGVGLVTRNILPVIYLVV
jgi:hypothetical protein